MRAASSLLLLVWVPALAWAAPDAEGQALLDRAEAREKALGEQKARAETVARQQALTSYRLARRQQLGYLGSPAERLKQTLATDAAILALDHAAGDARALDAELNRVRCDHSALVAAVNAARPGSSPVGTHFARPTRGTMVGMPGTRHDADTNTDLRVEGVEVLVRLNETVRAPAEGIVRRVEALPQGGYAVVTSHPDGWSSILSGMRDVEISAGEAVQAGQTLGKAGRNVDGAAVITVELWHRRRPVDPRTVMRGLRR